VDLQSDRIDRDNNSYPVPLIIVSERWEGRTGGASESPSADLSLVKPSGSLIDVAPTILKVMGIEKPEEMTGKSLI